MTIGTLFTIGYAGRTPADLAALLPPGCAVVDVRLRAWSADPAWRSPGPALEALGLSSYRHDPRLGNLAYRRGGPIEIADLAAIEDVLHQLHTGADTALLCVCRTSATCHRTTLAQEARRRSPEISVVAIR